MSGEARVGSANALNRTAVAVPFTARAPPPFGLRAGDGCLFLTSTEREEPGRRHGHINATTTPVPGLRGASLGALTTRAIEAQFMEKGRVSARRIKSGN